MISPILRLRMRLEELTMVSDCLRSGNRYGIRIA